MEENIDQLESELKDKFRELLYSIFRVQDSQLNFGIYRIFNMKRNEIRTFIEKELQLDSQKAVEKYYSDNKISLNAENYIKIQRTAKIRAYQHLFDFFSRYYIEGDFVSQRRYSKDPKYLIPYNGEEVFFLLGK